MYVSTYNKQFPTGRGLKWSLNENDNLFYKRLMTRKNISLASCEWISTIEQMKPYRNKNGEICKIRYGWNSEEVKLGEYFVDGLVEVDGAKTILEYQGCKFHQCYRCNTKVFDTKNQKVKYYNYTYKLYI